MFTDYKAAGIVLEAEARGEADKKFTLFSKEFGRLEVVGRSIRKIGSKLKGGIALFSLSNIEFVQGRHYKILTFSEIEKEFKDIKENPRKLKVAYRIRDVVDQLITEPETDTQVWNFILKTFIDLNGLRFIDYQLQVFYHFFSWRLLALLGRQPELSLCLGCRKKLKPKGLYFSLRGGVLCQDCSNRAKKEGSATKISADAVKLLREIDQRPFSFVRRINVKERYLRELDSALELYVS